MKNYNQWSGPNLNRRITKVIEIVEERCPNFEFVEYYQGSGDTSRIDLKCKQCGAIINRSMISVRHKNVRCDVCYQKELNEINEQKEKQKEKRKRALEKQKQITSINKFFNHEQKKQIKQCAICGKEFITYNSRIVCCSKQCSVKRTNKGKDNRINKNNLIDKDITLDKLYERDNGICYICRCECNWNDKQYKLGKDGRTATVVGPSYPSIEHVIEICNGGTHSWDNVRLACKHCNETKEANRKKD